MLQSQPVDARSPSWKSAIGHIQRVLSSGGPRRQDADETVVAPTAVRSAATSAGRANVVSQESGACVDQICDSMMIPASCRDAEDLPLGGPPRLCRNACGRSGGVGRGDERGRDQGSDRRASMYRLSSTHTVHSSSDTS